MACMLRRRWQRSGVFAIVVVVAFATGTQQSATYQAAFTAQTVTIHGVTLDISGSFLPGLFHTTEYDDNIQLASASTAKPFRDLTIVAMAFGTQPPTEAVPKSVDGGVQADRDALLAFRLSQTGASPGVGPSISAPIGGVQPMASEQVGLARSPDGIRLDVFIVGTDGAAWWNYMQNGSTFSSWVSLAGGFNGAPTAA